MMLLLESIALLTSRCCAQGSSLTHLTALQRLQVRMRSDYCDSPEAASISLDGLPASLRTLDAQGYYVPLTVAARQTQTGSIQPRLGAPLHRLRLIGYAAALPAHPPKLPVSCHVEIQVGSLLLGRTDETDQAPVVAQRQLAAQLLAAWVADCGVARVTIHAYPDGTTLNLRLHRPGMSAPTFGSGGEWPLLTEVAALLAPLCERRGYICSNDPECDELVIVLTALCH
jgi:hypothetical protein